MRKWFGIVSFLFVLMIAGCTEVSAEYIQLELNPGVDTIQIGSTHIDRGATAYYGLRALDVVVISNNVDPLTIGTYEIVYEATYSGVTKVIRRLVDVVDMKPPVLSLNPGIDTIIEGQLWIDAGVSIEDHSEIVSVVVEGEVGSSTGDYIITYRVVDVFGNTSSIQRIVSVITPIE